MKNDSLKKFLEFQNICSELNLEIKHFPDWTKDILINIKSIIGENQFDSNQMCEIRLGFQDGLKREHVEIYAKPEFNAVQMFEIRLKLHPLVYVKPKFNLE